MWINLAGNSDRVPRANNNILYLRFVTEGGINKAGTNCRERMVQSETNEWR